MTMYNTSRTTYGTASAVNRFFAALNDIFAAIVAWNDARATRNALASLTDRELDDIGLTRSEIDAVAESNLIR